MARLYQMPRLVPRISVSSLLLSRRPPPSMLRRLLPNRHASSSVSTTTRTTTRLKAFLYTTGGAVISFAIWFYATDTRASFHRWLVPRLMRLIYPDAEDAHRKGISAIKNMYEVGLHPRERQSVSSTDHALSVDVFGHTLANPIGISGGLDKKGEIPDPLFALGAGIVEVGGVTPLPHPGNAKPRFFRLPSLDGFVNRFGLNSDGAVMMQLQLRNRVRRFAKAVGLSETEVLDGKADVPPGSLTSGRLLAVQVAKNKNTPGNDVGAVVRDYTYCVERLAPYADILVVNVSSPNTPGLRDLQATEPLTQILTAVVDEAQKTQRKTRPKVMVKVSPDEDTDVQIEGIVQAVWRSGVDGVIVGNTTNRRIGLVPHGMQLPTEQAQALTETGGYSGPQMFSRTLDLVKRYRKALDGQDLAEEAATVSLAAIEGAAIGMTGSAVSPTGGGVEQKVIFASGGITNGEQALQILNAGASVAMVYTALIYGGAGTITTIKEQMKDEMKKA